MPYNQMRGMSRVCRLHSASRGGGINLEINEVSFLLSQSFSSALQAAGVGLVSVKGIHTTAFLVSGFTSQRLKQVQVCFALIT